MKILKSIKMINQPLFIALIYSASNCEVIFFGRLTNDLNITLN